MCLAYSKITNFLSFLPADIQLGLEPTRNLFSQLFVMISSKLLSIFSENSRFCDSELCGQFIEL